MRSGSLAIMVLLLLAFCSSCVVMGANKEYQPFDSNKLEVLVPGQTTAGEVSEKFGAPSQVVKMSNGNAYIYKRSMAKGTALWLVVISFGNYDKQYDRIVFFFNDRDILTHYGVSKDADKAAYGFSN